MHVNAAPLRVYPLTPCMCPPAVLVQDEDWARRAAAEEEAAALDTRSAELYSRLLLHSVTAPLPAPAAAAPAPALLALPAPSDITGTPPPPRRGRYRRHYFARNMLWTFQDLKMLIGETAAGMSSCL